MKSQRKIASDLDQIPETLVVTNNFPVCSSRAYKLKHTLNKKHHTLKKMAVFTLEDEQIVWTDKSSDGYSTNVNSRWPTLIISKQISRKPWLLSLVPFPQDEQNRPFVRLSPSDCEFRSNFGRLVRLDEQIKHKQQ